MLRPLSTADEYAIGCSDGYFAGEYDKRNLASVVHHIIADTWDDIHNARTVAHRAYCLGWLRGYRSAVRTFVRGRWGT